MAFGATLCLVAATAGLSVVTVAASPAAATARPAGAHPADDGGRGGATNDALRSQLEADTGGNATFADSNGDGVVTFIGVNDDRAFQAKGGASQETIGRSFVDSYGALFGIRDASTDLVQSQSFRGDTGGAVRYQQTYNGVPVIAGQVAVQVGANGAVQSATGEASPNLDIDTTPTVAIGDAAASAVALVAKVAGVDPSTLSAEDGTLSIYDPSLLGANAALGTRLVWRFDVRNAIGDPDYFVAVDARDGTIALQFDQTEAALNRSVCDNAESTTLPPTCTTPVRTEGQAPVGAAHPDADNAYDLSGITYNFYKTQFGRDSVDNLGLPLKSTVRYCPDSSHCPYGNAFWNGSQMVYGQGYANADDVVGHELTHGVTQYTSGLLYYGASGALNESMSDVMGEFIDQVNVGPNDTPANKWLLGEDLVIGAIRSMKDPTVYSDPDRVQSPLYVDDTSDNHDVHTNSGVNNKADFLITDGGSFNGQTITGLGLPKAAAIYYQLETTLLTPGSDYLDEYVALPQACNNLVGTTPVGSTNGAITVTDCQQVSKAVKATEMNLRPTSGTYSAVPVCGTGLFRNSVAFSDNMESTTGQWTTATSGNGAPWTYFTGSGSSGTHALNVVDNTGPQGASILQMTNTFVVPASPSYFSFQHSFETDYSTAADVYDGGVVEYTTDGTAWHNISGLTVVNPPAATIDPGYSNPYASEAAYGANSGGYITTRVDTSSLTGQLVKFRFRFGIDSYVDFSYPGWFIDDTVEYGCGATAVTPGAPTTVTASPSAGAATVNWVPPFLDGGITGYTITPFIGATAQPATTVLGASVTSALITGLTNGTSYTFKVTAAGSGPSAFSTASNAVTPRAQPAAPTAVTATAGPGAAQAFVSWTAPASNGSAITGYTVTPYIGGVAQPTFPVGPATFYLASGLPNGTTYTFKVTATNAVGPGPASAASNAMTTITVPGAPTGVTAAAASTSSINVSWAAPSSNGGSPIISYAVTPSTGGSALAAVTVAGTSASITGLTPSTTYTFTVKASNVAGSGPGSASASATTPAAVDSSPPPVTTPTPKFVSLLPARLLDTRDGGPTTDGQFSGIGLRAPGSVTALTVAGRGGVAADAAAVVLNITVTVAADAGYISVYPCGGDPPTASSVNYVVGQTIPNLVASKVGTNGQVCLFTQSQVHLLADVSGYFPQGSSLTSLVPARLLDTRPGQLTTDGVSAGIGQAGAASVTQVQVTGRAGVPADASAAVLNVTVTGAQGAGYVTVYPCGGEPPTASNLNYVAGETIANAVVTKIGDGGKVCIFSQAATDLVADVNGYFPSDPSLTPLVPARLLDSRPTGLTTDGQSQALGVRPAGSVTEVVVTGRGGVPSNATAVVLNVTVTEAAGAGYATVYPCGSEPPTASNLNYGPGDTIANAVITQVGAGGEVCIFTQQDTQLLADVNAYFAG
ncbi:MAG: putative thermolysin family peptidase [Ilumatobacteraceae bacterium]|nr:putative thermolysin family peptidase [Ilumatobacteraceae bacterium]